jgi:ribose transport system substrate-binding protein
MDEKKGAPQKVKSWFQRNKDFQEIQEHVNKDGLVGFAEKQAKSMDRRKFMSTMAMTAGGLTALSQFGFEPEAQAAPKRFKAAYAAVIMAVFWVTKGAETFQHLGKIAGFDFDIYDATADAGKQRSQIDLIASKADEYDVVFIHPAAIGAYTEPVKELISKGVVVVDIDTLLVPDLSTLDILTFTEPDNIYMGSAVTEYLCQKIGYKGNVVHTQGQLTHTGAQGRAKGFRQVVSKYPDIKVIDETPGEWQIDKTRQIWDSLLVKYDKIDGGFFHNDDMALGAYAALQAVDRAQDTVLCGVDAMAPALRELKKGHIQATVFNPACRVHGYAFWAAWFHLVNKVKKADIPTFIRCDGPMVTVDSTPEEIDSYIWCNEHYLI